MFPNKERRIKQNQIAPEMNVAQLCETQTDKDF